MAMMMPVGAVTAAITDGATGAAAVFWFGGASSSIVALCVVVACFRRLSLLDVFHFGLQQTQNLSAD